MGDKTGIEWTDATWNPVAGCSLVSPGCTNCYAMKLAARIERMDAQFKRVTQYEGLTQASAAGPVWTGKVAIAWHNLDVPLRWAKPRRIFVNSMSDLFHEGLSVEEIAEIYGVAIAAVHLRGHTLQVLTKRAARMREVLHREDFWEIANSRAESEVLERVDPLDRRKDDARATLKDYDPDNPPPGIMLGVSTEDQARADERMPELARTPAWKRFISAEPLLGHIDMPGMVDWVIAGGESGAGARPTHPDWVRSLRDQCAAGDIPFFFKQWGEWAPGECGEHAATRTEDVAFWFDGRWDYSSLTPRQSEELHRDDEPEVYRFGKKRSGAKLDGELHRAFPA